MNAAAAVPSISPEDYLAMERASPYRHEYINGMIFAMAGGSIPHNDIVVNLTALNKAHLRGRGCKVHVNDVRVLNKATGFYLYPELFILCGKPIYTDIHEDCVVNPLVVIEVLSPSTEGFDKGDKFAHYKLLESFQVYVLVSQNQPFIQKFTRNDEGWQLTEYASIDSVLSIEAIQFSAPLSEIYEGITFDEPSRTAPRLVISDQEENPT